MANNCCQPLYPFRCKYPALWDVPSSWEAGADLVWSSQERWSTSAGRLFGVEVRIHLSLWIALTIWFAIVLIGADYLSPGRVLARIGRGLVVVCALFGSILAHEMAHAMVARMMRKPVKGVMLHPLGGVALIGIEILPSRLDFLVYLAGPSVNLVIAAALAGFDHSPAAQLISVINRDIGIFNLVPIYPLDGGRILMEMLILRGSSPTTRDRLTWTCTKLCAAGLVVYGVITRDIFLAVFVLLLGLLARWLLAENLKETAALIRDPIRSEHVEVSLKRRPGILIMIVLLALILCRQTAGDADIKTAPRFEKWHQERESRHSPHPGIRGFSVESKQGKSTVSTKAIRSRPKKVQNRAAKPRAAPHKPQPKHNGFASS